jgi:hypothetical protein
MNARASENYLAISRSSSASKSIQIIESACAYLDLLPHIKRMLTEIYAGNQYFIIQ